MSTSRPGAPKTSLILTGMIFAVAMTFIDQTIVSIAAPRIQAELHLSSTGLQWAVNAYLLALAAFFTFGGRLADTLGHVRMVVIGIVVFAGASALCGLTPKGSLAQSWIIAFRAVQGLGGALMYPAALAIVVNAYEVRQRGRALATFFGVAGGLTAVGPVLGGYLTVWTWRSIFWINVPVALVALALIAVAKPSDVRRPAPMDYRGLALVVTGVGLSVFGLQQSARWGWSNPGTTLAIVAGVALLIVFVSVERRTASPLMNVSIFRDRGFAVDSAILGVAMMVFVPIFFFASEYAQISLGKKPSEGSLTLLYFFAGFVVAAQIGGRMLDRGGAFRPVVLGSVLGCVGLALWAGEATTLSMSKQVWYIVLAGAGLGFLIGQANTDALNRAPSTAYGEATGITQTLRNYGSSLGLAVLGTIQVTAYRSKLAGAFVQQGVPSPAAHQQATAVSQLSSSPGGKGGTGAIPHFVQVAFADATQTVLYVMAGIMAVAFLIAVALMPRTSPDLAGADTEAVAGSNEAPRRQVGGDVRGVEPV